jgi:LAO/AO transport system kinase
MMVDEDMLNQIQMGDQRTLSRAISMIVNGAPGVDALLSLPASDIPVVGITGPPGAGKSSLTDKLIGELVREGNNVAVLCIDPSSPYTKGAILGDRIRMTDWYDNPHVFIRSLATRGSLGGLPADAANVIELLKSAPFDFILIETVGVGQNEIEIASLADVTVVVLVPESGDDIQVMKAGLMEIADIFVVNKCDRPGADALAADIRSMLHESSLPRSSEKRVVKTIANTQYGVGDLIRAINYFVDKKNEN